ncbi:MAG: shikimate dehydrogenase [Kiritimatiellae bacterium]|nr:shikimate dehydrogenase [Kiritimatiellia bacterium]
MSGGGRDWPNAQTQLFAVLGHPVAHSLSPVMHNAALRELGLNAVYLAFDVRPEEVPAAIRGLAAIGCAGANVTVPLKEIAARCVVALDESAQRAGAVNTIRFTPEGPVGHSTDGEGFLRGVREAFDVSPRGLRVFVLGCGGAGRTVALECARAGAAAVTVCDAAEERAARLRAELRAAAPAVAVAAVPVAEAARAAAAAELIVQATPVGLHEGDLSPLPPEAFARGVLAYDLIYHRPVTPFMRAAESAGARAANGLGMLLHQGVRALELWTGRTAPVDVMRAALERAVYG